MMPPSPPIDELWQRLADAQDAAVARAVSNGQGVPSVPSVQRSAARSTRWRLKVGVVAMTVGAAAASLAVYNHRAPLRVQLGQGGQPGAPGETVVADARSDLPLLFSDGSTVTFRAGAAGRMQRLTAAGAELEIDRGRLEAHVVHAASTLWLVHAGPYQVRVTGTRFVVDWVSPRLNVAVYEGSVIVEGGALGAGIPLRAGQHLTVGDGVVRTESLAAGPLGTQRLAARTGGGVDSAGMDVRAKLAEPGHRAEAAEFGETAGDEGDREGGIDTADPAATTLGRETVGAVPGPRSDDVGAPPAARSPRLRVTAARVSPARDRDWLSPAERGEYAEALALARQAGWANLCARLDARRLLMLGDVARYAAAPAEARRAFKALVRRFPADRLAGDAVFSLGRLAFEADHAREAATWFRLYVNRWPGGPMADQALGRLLECSVRINDDVGARAVSRDYLTRAPRGPHASLASKILKGKPVGSGIVGPSGQP